MTTSKLADRLAAIPDPGGVHTLDALTERLQSLKIWAGNPSYEAITERINGEWIDAGRPEGELARRSTVADCFKTGRRRLNADLLEAIVQALHPDAGYVAQWRQVLRSVLGETRAAVQVRAEERLPDDVADFTGRAAELDALLRLGDDPHAPVLVAIEGMAGVGKTHLAIHAGHRLAAARDFDHVLFVNLRGFHPDPAQPPADPGAVLDSLLRLLGVSGQRIPHEVAARSALLRQLLTGRRTLLVLDNAAGEEQVRPLLPGSPGSLTVVTTRRSLTRLPVSLRVAIDVFSADEAVAFLESAAGRVPVGLDPQALQRISHRCGYLPLALSLLAARMRSASGWTLTEHADRLDERHRIRRLDSGVEIALGLSYHHLPAARRRLLRLLALHPGPDFDAYAAAALAQSDLDSTTDGLRQLCLENLLREGPSGRYAVHDLVRAHAVERAGDEDPPSQRRTALAGLFDHYLAASAAAMDLLYPADRDRRPRVAAPPTPIPPMPDAVTARAWLDTERINLVATAICATSAGSHRHSIQLAATLLRYLIGGYFTDAITIFDQARIAAQREDDATQEAEALFGLGTVHGRLGRHSAATDYLRSALERFGRAGNRQGQARTLGNLGAVAQRRADYGEAAGFHQRALALFEEVGDDLGAARALNNLGDLQTRHGNYEQAVAYHERSLHLHRQIGDSTGEAAALINLGTVEDLRGRHAAAADHHRRALELYRLAGHQSGQAWALDGIACACTGLRRPETAAEYHRQSLELFQQIGERDGEAWAHNGLGEAARLAGDLEAAMFHHRAALAIAQQAEAFDQEARAHNGIGGVHHAEGRRDEACRHWQLALDRYTELGSPAAGTVRAALDAIAGR